MIMPRQTRRLILACAGLLLTGGPLHAAETSPPAGRVMGLGYEVYLGGMHIFSMEVDMALRPDGYSVAAAGGTRGMIGWIYKWDIKVAAEGREEAGSIRPLLYESATDWQKNPRSTRLAFAGKGSYDVQRTPVEPADPDDDTEMPSHLPENTVDPLSLAVAATRALAANGQCAQTLPVFDGKRRYDLTIKDLGEATIPPNRYSIYNGPATRCGFTMQRISGFNKKYSRSRQWDEDSDAPPTIWMAQVHEGVPPVPVRYEGAIALGNMVIHLTKAEVRSELAANAP